eukprot:SAG11_NODE_1401_length_5015_cov_14.634662_2_plen_241_part_00
MFYGRETLAAELAAAFSCSRVGVGLPWPERAPTASDAMLYRTAVRLQAGVRGMLARHAVAAKREENRVKEALEALMGTEAQNKMASDALIAQEVRRQLAADSAAREGGVPNAHDENCGVALVLPYGHVSRAGAVASWGYRLLSEQPLHDVRVLGQVTGCPQTIIIIGTSHTWGEGAIDWEEGEEQVALSQREWCTALGPVAVDSAISDTLRWVGGYRVAERYHTQAEISIEAQLPFIQAV